MSPQSRARASIGRLLLAEEYRDPVVDVDHEFRTIDHEIITPEPRRTNSAIQFMGRRPARITVEAYVYEDHVAVNDRLGEFSPEKPFRSTVGSDQDGTVVPDDPGAPLFVQTERWWGTAVPTNTSYEQQRAKRSGHTLYQINTDLREVAEKSITDDAIGPPEPASVENRRLTPDNELPEYAEPTGSFAGLEQSAPQQNPDTSTDVDSELTAPLVTDYSDLPSELMLPTGTSKVTGEGSLNSRKYVGRLAFRKRFDDPIVDVSVRQEFEENNLLGGRLEQRNEFEARSTGITAPTITVNAVVTEDQLDVVDKVGRTGMVLVNLDTWSGTAAVQRISTTDRREADPEYNQWLHDVTIELRSLIEDEIMLPATIPPVETESVPSNAFSLDVDEFGAANIENL